MPDAQVPDPVVATDRVLLQAVLQQILARVRREQFETWFRSMTLVRGDDREIELSVTSQFVRDWLHKNFLATLQESVVAAVGKRRVVLSLREEDGVDNLALVELPSLGSEAAKIVESARPRTPTDRSTDRAADRTNERAPGRVDSERPVSHDRSVPASALPVSGPLSSSRRLQPSQLNPNYTFDKFVVGPCNRLAHASALAIGENPGCAYNPLFIHGNVGLGKTHLLQAICHTVMRRDPSARVLYLSCEDFTNAFIHAIQNGGLDEFRALYRNVDVLVVDDIQFLAQKEKTQDEFFHTFNTLYDGQRQIVISSDRPPIEIPTVEERLVSRFKWGLVAEIEAPCLETRAAIVRRKAKGRGADIGDDVALFIAERITTNIRELEGAVIKVVGVAAITDRPITRQLAEEALRGVALHRHAQISVDDVITLITGEFAISARDLTGKSRTQAVSLPRQIAMYLIREHTELSLEDVGRFFGNRDHTTVLYAVTKIGERATKDRMFHELLSGLGSRLVTRSFRQN